MNYEKTKTVNFTIDKQNHGSQKKNNLKLYLTHNEQNFVVAEKFIALDRFRTLMNKTDKHMTSLSKNKYILINQMI